MIIGIAGPTASGKTTVAHLLEKKFSAVRMRYSTLLADMARERDLDPEDKETLQQLFIDLHNERGADFLAVEMKERVALLRPEMLVIEGNRRKVDFAMLKELAKERNEQLLLIYIDAEPAIRLERYNKRLERQDEKPIDLDEFMELESNEAESELKDLKATAQDEGIYIRTDQLSESDTMEIIEQKIEG